MSADGRIVDSPPFFAEALELEDRSCTMFELYDPDTTPFLDFRRIYRRQSGAVEYHVSVEGEFGQTHAFRYWDMTPTGNVDIATFYMVDDSSVHLQYDWQLKRLRSQILEDLEESFLSDLRNRVSTLSNLAEVLRDSEQAAPDAARRIIGFVEDIDEKMRALSVHLDPGDHPLVPVRVIDLPGVIASWGDKSTEIACFLEDIDRDLLIAASLVDEVLYPVVINAVESNPRGQTIEVTIRPMPPRRVVFEINDDGRGMSAYELSRAEDPFFTTKRGHVGLGLTKAREKLRAAQGYWDFRSKRGKGTRARVCIPLMDH